MIIISLRLLLVADTISTYSNTLYIHPLSSITKYLTYSLNFITMMIYATYIIYLILSLISYLYY